MPVRRAGSLKGAQPAARVLEGPVPARKIFGPPGSGIGAWAARPTACRASKRPAFEARFPFGTVTLADAQFPLEVELTGWSPFEPGDADNSSLPVAALEYRFTNRAARAARGRLLLQRQKLHGHWAAIPQAVRPSRRRLHPLERRPGGQAVGRRRVFRHGVRTGCQGELCLVSRRVVGRR